MSDANINASQPLPPPLNSLTTKLEPIQEDTGHKNLSMCDLPVRKAGPNNHHDGDAFNDHVKARVVKVEALCRQRDDQVERIQAFEEALAHYEHMAASLAECTKSRKVNMKALKEHAKALQEEGKSCASRWNTFRKARTSSCLRLTA